MKTQKLIPLLDYVLEQHESLKYDIPIESNLIDHILRIKNYAKFLSQPLKLSMFVVCDEQGNILKEPTVDNYMQPKEIDRQYEAYNKAKSNILFEGFEVEEIFNDSFHLKHFSSEGIEYITVLNTDNIHGLLYIDFYFTLTENAVKLING